MSLPGPAVAFFVLPKTYIPLMPNRAGSTCEAMCSAIRSRQRQWSSVRACASGRRSGVAPRVSVAGAK